MRKPISKEKCKSIVTKAVEGSDLMGYARDFLSQDIDKLEEDLINSIVDRLDSSMVP